MPCISGTMYKVSCSLKLGGGSDFWNLDKEGGHEKNARNRGVSWKGAFS